MFYLESLHSKNKTPKDPTNRKLSWYPKKQHCTRKIKPSMLTFFLECHHFFRIGNWEDGVVKANKGKTRRPDKINRENTGENELRAEKRLRADKNREDWLTQFRSRWWGSSLTLCAHLTVRSSPHQHERIFSGARVCRVTFKHLPQHIQSHIWSFGTLG